MNDVTRTSKELLPCPFCGGQPSSQWHGGTDETGERYGYHAIECCDSVYIHAEDSDTAIAMWNKRHAHEPCVHPWESIGISQDGHPFCAACVKNLVKDPPWSSPPPGANDDPNEGPIVNGFVQVEGGVLPPYYPTWRCSQCSASEEVVKISGCPERCGRTAPTKAGE